VSISSVIQISSVTITAIVTETHQISVPPASTSSQEPASSTVTTSSAAPPTTDSSTTSAPAVSDPPATSTVQTVTADGTVRTVTIISQPTYTGGSGSSDGAGQDPSEEDSGGGGGLGTGATVGIVVGVILAVLAIAGVGLFLFFRRRKRNQAEAGFENDPSVRGGGSPGVGSSNSRSEMGMAGTPMSPGSLATTRRNSQLQIDPRMDPFKNGLYGANASRESINTIRDDHDYSRRIQPPKVLRATNPDVDQD
jgi:cell wall integrity and stress response component